MHYVVNYESRPTIRCIYCRGIFPYMRDFELHSCDAVMKKMNWKEEDMHIPIELTQCFDNPGGKTLKLQIKKGVPLEAATRNAFGYVNTPGSTYTRVEFKFEGCYIVVAKLKD